MNIVDYIVFGLFGFYFWRGYSKGLFRSILGPVSLALSAGYSYFYFQRTNNVLVSIGICIFGPLVLSMALAVFFAIFKKADGAVERKKNPHEFQHRLLGGMINVSWMGFLVLLSLFLFLLIPVKMPGLESARQSIMQSKIFDLALAQRMPFVASGFEPVDLDGDREYLSALEKTAEYDDLMKDPRVRQLFANEGIRTKIENKDIAGLFNEPDIQEMMRDPALIQKFLNINKKMIEVNRK